MNCSHGTCVPTAAKAVLNSGDLQSLLASGSVTVTTSGSGVQATNIIVSAPVSWSTASNLTLESWKSITVSQPLAVSGSGGLSLDTDNGGSGGVLSFGTKGDVTFASLASSLTVNGTAYTLVNSLAGLGERRRGQRERKFCTGW